MATEQGCCSFLELEYDGAARTLRVAAHDAQGREVVGQLTGSSGTAVKVHNVHERQLSATPDAVAALFGDMDQLWPTPDSRRRGRRGTRCGCG